MASQMMQGRASSAVKIENSFSEEDENSSASTDAAKHEDTVASRRGLTGSMYTAGMYDLGLPELLVQDVPRDCAGLVSKILLRLTRRLRTGHRFYTDSRIIEENRYYFRIIEVDHDAYSVNLLHHVMKKWGKGRRVTDSILNSVKVMVLTPWFVENMEEWATLPPPPRGRHDCRDKIFLAALFGDCRGQGRGRRYNSFWTMANDIDQVSPEDDNDQGDDDFSDSDAAYFLMHTDYFLRLLDVPDTPSFVYRMPQSFQRRVLAMGDRMTVAAAARISRQVAFAAVTSSPGRRPRMLLDDRRIYRCSELLPVNRRAGPRCSRRDSHRFHRDQQSTATLSPASSGSL